MKNYHFLFSANYIKDYFVDRNHHIAHDNFQKTYTKFIMQKGNYCKRNSQLTSKELNFNGKIK